MTTGTQEARQPTQATWITALAGVLGLLSKAQRDEDLHILEEGDPIAGPYRLTVTAVGGEQDGDNSRKSLLKVEVQPGPPVDKRGQQAGPGPGVTRPLFPERRKICMAEKKGSRGRSRDFMVSICRLPARPGRAHRGRPTRLEAAERAWARERKELETAHGRPCPSIMGRPASRE